MKDKKWIQVDTHAHIFSENLPLAESRRYTPNYSASLSSYLAYLDKYNFTYGVLIQPSFLGADNRFMIQAIQQVPLRLKGVAVVEPNISLDQLQVLAESGIVGVRLNLIGQRLPDLSLPMWQTFFAYLRELNWHVELHCQASSLFDLLPFFIVHHIRVVIDHFGRIPVCHAVRDNVFSSLLKITTSELVWLKLSGMYRIVNNQAEEALYIEDVLPKLLNIFGAEHLMWGSDWPHTQYEKEMGYDKVANQIEKWLPNIVTRKKILSDTPIQFFGFN